LLLYQISLSICFPTTFRSSLHGKGLNRFWSNIEGYLGPLLLLISATGDAQEDSTNIRKWTICALTHQGFENRDVFYGHSGTLYAICPVFHAFSPSGMWFKWLRGGESHKFSSLISFVKVDRPNWNPWKMLPFWDLSGQL
jgi:hypothetical protein